MPKVLCGKWLPRSKAYCGLTHGHKRKCLSIDAVEAAKNRQPNYEASYRTRYPERVKATQKASKDKNRARERKRTLAYDTSVRSWLAQIKLAAGCADCGYNAHPVALDFDHLPGFEKSFNIARNLWKGRVVLEAEIAKCEVVCSNCHRIRSYNRLMEKLKCRAA